VYVVGAAFRAFHVVFLQAQARIPVLGDIVEARDAAFLRKRDTAKRSPKMTDNDQVVTDPVCQMKIRPSDAVASIEHDKIKYYFCSKDCADTFRESPEDYV
jgi:Cu+-exporting ATPase